MIINTRYSAPHTHIPRSGSLHILWEYAQHPDLHPLFVKLVCVTLGTFQCILAEIEGSTVFSNLSNHAQAPVEDQPAIALYCLGCFGNAASMDDVAFLAGIGHGTVPLYTK
ncbi:hypothetical protein FRC08_010328 [Ceratobasidium sp. 394]|nr:hypothetical protein FRC08_010328 [Ceratobasidium sp. 394]